MSYKVFLILPGDKKIWINRSFKTKAEAEKELKSAKKELASAVRIMDSGIVSDAVPKTKPAPKPASSTTFNPAVRVPRPDMSSTLTFVGSKGSHVVSIAPVHLSLIKQTFTSIKCQVANISIQSGLTSGQMTVEALTDSRIAVVTMKIPIKSTSEIEFSVETKQFKVGNQIAYRDKASWSLLGIKKMCSLTKCVKAQINADSLPKYLMSYCKPKDTYKAVIEIGKKNTISITEIHDNEALTSPLPIHKMDVGPTKYVKSGFNPEYLYRITKLYGKSVIVLGIPYKNNPVHIAGMNKGVQIDWLLAPIITE